MGTILFLTRASSEIGLGHLSRTHILAQAFLDRGYHTILVMLSPFHDIPLGWKSAFSSIQIPGYEADRAVFLEWFSTFIQSTTPCLIISDSPKHPQTLYHHIRSQQIPLITVDDNGGAPFPTDLVINQNPYATPELYQAFDLTGDQLLLGTDYVMIRDTFLEYPFKNHPHQDMNHILITMGAADPVDSTSFLLSSLQHYSQIKSLALRVLIGRANPRLPQIKNNFPEQTYPCPLELRLHEDNMAAMLDWADIILTAGGTTLFECLFAQVAVMTIQITDDQKRYIQSFIEQEAIIHLGTFPGLTTSQLLERFDNGRSLLQSKGVQPSSHGIMLDGQGKHRIINRIEQRFLS